MHRLVALSVAAVFAAGQGASIGIKPQARAEQPGELVVLTVTSEAPIEGLRAQAFGRDLLPYEITPREWRVLVGIDLGVTPGSHPVSLRWHQPGVGAARTATHDVVVTAKSFPTRTLTVDNAFVNPPESVQARIADEAKLIEAAWGTTTPARRWTGVFERPVPQEANSAFGSRSVFNGEARNPHSGADFASPAGTPIGAPNAGRVLLARDLYFTGNTVMIDHGVGLVSLVAHLSRIDVKEGDDVDAGAPLGLVGATGRVTGPHLHWAVRARGARIDPLSLLATLGAVRRQKH